MKLLTFIIIILLVAYTIIKSVVNNSLGYGLINITLEQELSVLSGVVLCYCLAYVINN